MADLDLKPIVVSRKGRVWVRLTLRLALGGSSICDIRKYKERVIAVTKVILFLHSSPPTALKRSRSLQQTPPTSQYPGIREKIISSFRKS